MTTEHADEQQHSIATALRHAQLSIDELWIRYFGLGGDAGVIDIDAYVHGLGGLPALQRDILAHAINERLDELAPRHRAAYSRPAREGRPRDRSLSALVELLEGAELAPPERLPALVDAAARALGVRITMYLVDHDARHLHPWTGDHHGRDGQVLELDTTPAGRAFRQVEVVPARTGTRPRLWVPLVDGVERLGVLNVEVDDPAQLDDPGLRTQCRWLSILLGHLVALLTRYGDAVDVVRQPAPRTVPGELIWSLMPPLTAGVDNFLLTGLVQPCTDVNGDAFDYSLSESTATVIVLDAVGRDLRSGLIAATALATHRRTRRAGCDLREQARAIDEAISRQFGNSAFATAVLAEIELATGRLRYLNAGHPSPLLVRGGRIVKPPALGAPPLGMGVSDLTVTEDVLRPDDWLVLHTDGVTHACDRSGERFGDARLAEFLQREAAEGNPPPETARRLVQAVLTHQDGALQDDATVVLARWTDPRTMVPGPSRRR